ncbi:unnamed protein product [Caenorhabditis brenneri]
MEIATTTFNPYDFALRTIYNVPEYKDFKYTFNWTSLLLIIILIYTIPCFLIFSKIAVFFLKNKKKIKESGLSLDIFQAFLAMQSWNLLMIIGEFLMFRIPYTGVFTRHCANEYPELMMRCIVFFFYWGFYTSQMLTVMFCGLRVYLLYSFGNSEKKREVQLFSFVFMLFGFLLSLPQFLSGQMCLQMQKPYPFGAVILISEFYYYNVDIVAFLDFLFSTFVTLAIIGFTTAMLLKIRSNSKLVPQSAMTSTRNLKAERALTGTMIVLLIPQVIYQLNAAAEVIGLIFYEYILFIGHVALDTRVHLVTCYFYFTHPVFKKKGLQPPATIKVSS